MIRPLTERSPLHSLNTTHRAERCYYQADYLSSPEMSPLQSVPQIRIDMDPDDDDDDDDDQDNTFYRKSRGSETSL